VDGEEDKKTGFFKQQSVIEKTIADIARVGRRVAFYRQKLEIED